MTADCFKISLDTLYEQRAMIKRGRNRKFKREYAVCQLVDSRNELQLLRQDEMCSYPDFRWFQTCSPEEIKLDQCYPNIKIILSSL